MVVCALPCVGRIHVLDHSRGVCAAPVSHPQRVREFFREAYIGQLQTCALGSGQRIVQIKKVAAGSPGEVAVSHEGCQEGIGTDRWHPLGLVLYIAVIARDVPAEDARSAPVQIVPDKSLDQPALTLRGAATDVVGVIACENVEFAHFFAITVIEIKFDVPGAKLLILTGRPAQNMLP